MPLTDPAFFKQLDRLRVQIRAARGHRPGETPIPRSSQAWGIEFEAYKEYAPGDDFRYLDWNAVGRLDQLVVKRFTAEREISFHLFLDTSASMGAPAIDQKFVFASDLAAALSYVVLTNNNTLRLIALSSPEKNHRPFLATPFLRHRSAFQRVQPFLATLVPAGRTYLRETLRAYVEQTKEPGVAVVISDFLTGPSQYEEALGFLRARGYEVEALQVLGAAELSPERLFRRGKLYDVEDQSERWISLTPANLRRYQEVLQAHLDGLQQFCHRQHILYARISTASSLVTLVTEELTQAGLLALR
ncbi:MAG: DUF58 domain-containing protein [Candidatus Binatia bacterium]